jgi:surface carbohydrate biosynthesis protein (TIGR04326 family)
MIKSVLVIDQFDESTNQDNNIICWRSYQKGMRVTSLPAYLEEHAERLRDKYLSFIHELGETVVNGKSLVEHMKVSGDFSFWWMSHLAEKSPFKSPRLYDCLRMLALEEVLSKKKPSHLYLISSDKLVTKSISNLCKKLKINFSQKKDNFYINKLTAHNIYRSLPYALQGLISLRHVFIRWPLQHLKKPKWFSDNKSIFICSYFYHMDTNAGDKGEFYSRQWEGLPKFLNDNELKINWIHHFLISPGMPSVNKSLSWFKSFNRDSAIQGNHAFIESYLSYGIVLKVLKHWLRMNVVSLRLLGIRKFFITKDSSVDLWPILKHDWKISLIGSSAVNNFLWFELFDSAFRDMPHQEKGLYLWENQGWEAALVHAWKKNGHGSIIGVPHSTMRYWALNNFDDIRTLNSSNHLSKPLPDYLAVNGQQAWNKFNEAAYPNERLIKVEALRYQYLISDRSIGADNKHQGVSSTIPGSKITPIRVLIIGDFSIKQTYKMLKCFENAQDLVDEKIIVTVKPHPACQVNESDFPNLEFNVVDKPLADIMGDFDLAFSGNTTSGGLDAFLAGLATIVFIDDEEFNHSPLRDVDGVKFVANATELSLVMKNSKSKAPQPSVSDFFWLDIQFPRWRKALLTNKEITPK